MPPRRATQRRPDPACRPEKALPGVHIAEVVVAQLCGPTGALHHLIRHYQLGRTAGMAEWRQGAEVERTGQREPLPLPGVDIGRYDSGPRHGPSSPGQCRLVTI